MQRWAEPAAGAVLVAVTVWSGSGKTVRPPRRIDVSPGRIETNAFPMVAVDADGNRLRIPAPPQRIVSASLVTDEIVLDLVSPARVAAITPFALDAAVSNAANKARLVKHVIRADVERIISLESDLVLISRFTQPEAVDLLRAAGVPVFRVPDFQSLTDIRNGVLLLGRLLGAKQRAGELIDQFDRTIADVRRRAASIGRRPRILFYASGGYTSGRDTMIDQLIALTGGTNVAAEAGIVGVQLISKEGAVALDPEIVLRPAYYASSEEPPHDPRRELFDDPAWQGVAAVRDGRVYVISARHATTISHHVVKAAAEIARHVQAATGQDQQADGRLRGQSRSLPRPAESMAPWSVHLRAVSTFTVSEAAL